MKTFIRIYIAVARFVLWPVRFPLGLVLYALGDFLAVLHGSFVNGWRRS
jgi:hypothetical protein